MKMLSIIYFTLIRIIRHVDQHARQTLFDILQTALINFGRILASEKRSQDD